MVAGYCRINVIFYVSARSKYLVANRRALNNIIIRQSGAVK
jgi:hypothetical protein